MNTQTRLAAVIKALRGYSDWAGKPEVLECAAEELERVVAHDAAPAAEPEPAAWIVLWGLGKMRVNSVHLERKTAEEVAARIKSVTEIKPLYLAASTGEPLARELSDEEMEDLIFDASLLIGMSPGAWDTVDPKTIVRAILATAAKGA